MKQSKMLELVENLKVGEKVVIEKFKDHLFIDKKSLPTEWTPAPSDNINIHGVDLSILNEEDWFYVDTSLFKYLFKGDMFNENRRNLTYTHHRGSLSNTGIALCDKDGITLLRKATPDDLAPFFEKYPMYAPIKVGDIGLLFDSSKHIKDDRYTIGRLAKIRKGQIYEYEEKYATWKHFFKVSETETLAEIKERFLREVEK